MIFDRVLILTEIFVVSIKSFNTLESFRNNGHIYTFISDIAKKSTEIILSRWEAYEGATAFAGWFKSKYVYVPVISKTLERIETFNTNYKDFS